MDAKAFPQVAEDYPNITPETLIVRGFAEPVEVYRIGKSEGDNVAISIQQSDPLTKRQKVGLGTVLFTIFGVPCAVASTLSPLAIILGLGSFMVAISPVLNTLDERRSESLCRSLLC